ncbi:DUF2993 domain-containing protein [Sphaerospermopsis aphanizomenoides BCCUSP55]|uniref:LmeA family phospholipid-binding protein n=1 Tax=Sphaerospermopsis aphanizomenoides TaxID=459663 RepID=UPI000B148FCD|nr:DUF2993 domain-containing protein [Sphaerospermopsis aphanizomenoides]MBK1986663.1 DUF2993 domain-containing protein [Sphaerospermopsis aphanizomenoides BCCUSP55]
MTDKRFPVTTGKKIRLITKALTTAIKLWLRTQLTQVSQIEVEIGASDHQLLSGCIPSVFILATDAVYRGVHVTSIQMKAENIRVNIGGVLKGKSLQLLEIVPVVAELMVEEQHLNNSLTSELLSTAINDILVKLLPEQGEKSKPVSWQEITLDNGRLIVSGVSSPQSQSTLIEMAVSLELLNGQELQLSQIQIKYNQEPVLENDAGYSMNLGSDVDLQEINLKSHQLICRGRINVNP